MIREGSARVAVENEGLAVYVFDEAHRDEVVAALEASDGAESPALIELAATGKLVAYELCQDDPVDVEIALGDPLTAAEKKVAKWMRRVVVPLDVPSGRLRVETGNSLDDPDEWPGGEVAIDPGFYELALHRVNWDKMTGKLEAYDGPHEVLTLRPWTKKKRRVEPGAALIFYGDMPRAPFVGRYQIEDDVFRGQVISAFDHRDERRLNINLDRAAYDTLALRRGSRIAVRAAGVELALLCQGRMIPANAERFLGVEGYPALVARHESPGVGFLSASNIGVEPAADPRRDYRDYDFFVIASVPGIDDDALTPLFALEAETAIEIERLEPDHFETPTRRGTSWRIEGDALHATVMFATERLLCFDVDVKGLAKFGHQNGETLEIEINGDRRLVYDRRTMAGPDWDKRLASILKPVPDEYEERAEALEDTIYDSDGRLDRTVPGWQDTMRQVKALAFHPDDLARPPLILDFKENPDVPGWAMMSVRSGLAMLPNDPDEIHVDAATNTSVVIRKA